MALKTNSKKARENLHKYIMQAADYIRTDYEPETYGNTDLTTYKGTARAVYKIFKIEKQYDESRESEQMLFEDWATGLALNLFDYYLEDARETLGNILEQTQEERSRYTREQSEQLMTNMIYREISRA